MLSKLHVQLAARAGRLAAEIVQSRKTKTRNHNKTRRIMNFELIINPTDEKYNPEIIRAVLLMGGEIKSEFHKIMSMKEILFSVSRTVNDYGDGMLRLTYNLKADGTV